MSTDWVTDFVCFFVFLMFHISECVSSTVLYWPILYVHLAHTCACVWEYVLPNQYHESNHRTLGKGVFWCIRTCICKVGKNDANSEWSHCMRVHGTTIDEWRSFAPLTYFTRWLYRFVIFWLWHVYMLSNQLNAVENKLIRKRENTRNTNTFSFVFCCCCVHLTHKCQAFLHVN